MPLTKPGVQKVSQQRQKRTERATVICDMHKFWVMFGRVVPSKIYLQTDRQTTHRHARHTPPLQYPKQSNNQFLLDLIFSCNWLLLALHSYHHTHTHTHTHPFNGPLSGTTQVSRYQKGKTNLDFYWSERQWVAVASAGPYASPHRAPDR